MKGSRGRDNTTAAADAITTNTATEIHLAAVSLSFLVVHCSTLASKVSLDSLQTWLGDAEAEEWVVGKADPLFECPGTIILLKVLALANKCQLADLLSRTMQRDFVVIRRTCAQSLATILSQMKTCITLMKYFTKTANSQRKI